jgi:hypothetical protein
LKNEQQRFLIISEKYKWLKDDYPLSFIYLFFYLVALESQDKQVIEKRIEQLKSYTLFSYIYRIIFKYFLRFFLKKNLDINVNLGKFQESCTGNKTQNKLSKLLELLFVNHIRVLDILSGSKKLKKILNRFNLVEFINNEKLLFETLEAILKKEERYLKQYFKNINSLLFCDYGNENLIFFLNSLHSGAKHVVCVPHAYFHEFNHIYDFGQFCTGYICWSKNESKAIKDIFSEIETYEFGCPIYSKSYQKEFYLSRNIIKKSQLLILDPLFNPVYNSQEVLVNKMDAIKWIKEQADKNGVKFRVKIHRRDYISEVIEFMNMVNVEIANGDLIDLLRETETIIGFGSTVLYEAKVLGLNSFHISMGGLTDGNYEGVPSMNIGEFKSLYLDIISGIFKNENLIKLEAFDTNKFKEGINYNGKTK